MNARHARHYATTALAASLALGALFGLGFALALGGALVLANDHEACIEGAGDCDE